VTDTARRTTPGTVLSLLRRAIAYELGMWRSLFRWILRRPLAPHPGAAVFGYAGMVTPIFVAFIALSAVELPILHLILPWETVRLVADALGFYGLFWMIGLLASLRVHPHVVGDRGLRIRYGTSVDVTIPWDAIAEIRHRYRSPQGRTVRRERTDTGLILHVAIAHQTSVDVVFRQPTPIPLPRGAGEPVTELRFYADDPNALVARAREHLTRA
jgi:hypothetical protein